MPVERELGGRIRRLRLAKNLTLKDVEREAEVSATHVSEIERGKTSPTFGALVRVARALGVRPSRLIEDDPLPRISVVRAREARSLTDRTRGVRLLPRSAGVRASPFSLIEVTLERGAGHLPLPSTGEVFIHVLDGAIEIELRGETRRLRGGDSIHFRSCEPDTFRNVGSGETRMLWVATPAYTL